MFQFVAAHYGYLSVADLQMHLYQQNNSSISGLTTLFILNQES